MRRAMRQCRCLYFPGIGQRFCRGVTLVELIVSMVIISVASAGVLLAMTTVILGSADPQQLQQAVAIAEAYLEEIRQQPVTDPDGVSGEINRDEFDDIQDYNGLSEAPTDQTGAALPNLADYRVDVAIVASGALGPGGSQVPAASAFRIDVRLTRGVKIDLTLSSHRTDY